MMKTFIMKWRMIIPQLISLVFIILWIYAAVNKLIDYEKFQVQLGQSPLLTDFSEVVSWLIPALEISIALLLVFDATRKTGLWLSFSMMVMFTAYIIAITRFSDFVPCSCGGILEKLDWETHLVFNIIMMIISFAGVIVQNRLDLATHQSSFKYNTKSLLQ